MVASQGPVRHSVRRTFHPGNGMNRFKPLRPYTEFLIVPRIVALLTGLGLAISKRQVVRLVTAKLDSFRAEDEAVLRAGLAGAPFVTVDDTGARHAGKACFTTHIGSDRFTAFRTGPGK